MAKAKCFKCGGSAIADTFEQARKLINHAVGLSRGIKCGDTYNRVIEIKPKVVIPETKTSIPTTKDTSEKTISSRRSSEGRLKTTVVSETKEETSEKITVPTESSKQKSSKKE